MARKPKLLPVWDLRFGDLEGRLRTLRLDCRDCHRTGRYRLDRLIAQRGRHASVREWLREVASDCPRCARGQSWFNFYDMR